ncbi:hypothetical protein [Acidovorax sp. NCPPB 3576]|uniref:hypothetical protein n=1 Tax=Acidovorax sp. NCPPB 3576 TaxID=2940488 RepID=UPI00234A13C8|nr:hypothetical protein [Acidovorax sp. NCPPB 3576]WCM86678.1 hypothetical protein M5C98_14960 [Acidovorax sp. NCPPB 3576]
MFAELSAALGAARAMLDFTKAASDMAKQGELAALALDFNQKLIALTDTCNKLLDENQSLKRAVSDLENDLQERGDFENQALTFELKEVASGVFAHVPKGTTNPGASTLKYCATCFKRYKLSLLQQSEEPSRQIGLTCSDCTAKVVFKYYILQ